MGLVTVYTTLNLADADLVRSRLDAAGIPSELLHDLASLSMEGYSLTTGGIGVQVPAEHAENARALVEDFKRPGP